MAVTCENKTLAVGQQTEKKEMANRRALICDTRYLTSHLSQPSENEGCTSHQTSSSVPYCAAMITEYGSLETFMANKRIKIFFKIM
jgi:hypothetical protein